MSYRPSKIVAGLALLLLFATPVLAERQILKGAIPPAVAKLNLQPVGLLTATNRLHLSLGLGLHNRTVLTNLLQQLYDPGSTNYHRYLTLKKFTEQFGPTKAEYQQVLDFAWTNGFTVIGTYKHRRLVSVTATVAQIQEAFHIHLLQYNHPTEQRLFYAPDVAPTFDAGLPIQTVGGLNNYSRPHPAGHLQEDMGGTTSIGTGPGDTFSSIDFRKAYAPGVTNTGAGQIVGLVEFDGYYTNDITAYENSNSLPNVPLINIYEHGGSAAPDNNTQQVVECEGDIEMAIAMAPGLSAVAVFEGNRSGNISGDGDFDDVLAGMANSPSIKQFSSSWAGEGFNGEVGDNSNGDDSLEQLAAQGQTFFEASGDGDAYASGDIPEPHDSANAVIVGGTRLATDTNGNYVAESVWSNGSGGSGGGVSQNYSIPAWQQTVGAPHLNAVGGSTTQRNIPDVAMVAANIYVIYYNGLAGPVFGTSLATPLWAGFTALVNEQAANQGLPSVGFLNPAFYLIGQSANYTNAFHDITVGNNTNSASPNLWYAAPGYDLCTGWGTPNGTNLINALLPYTGATWVDFNSGQDPPNGNGSYDNPFKTLAEGTNAVPVNGNIWIETPGSSPETMDISKPMTIRAASGPVSIGEP